MNTLELAALLDRCSLERGRPVRLRVRLPGTQRKTPTADLVPVNVTYDEHRRILVIETAAACCGDHGRTCEYDDPCCESCPKTAHGLFAPSRFQVGGTWHVDGTKCVAPDLSAGRTVT